MNNKPETSADIIVEMRDLGKLDEKSSDKIPRSLMGLGLRTYADRLEAAWKRDKNNIEADALFVGGFIEASRKRELFTKTRETDNSGAAIYTNDNSGNCAKMREALKTVKRYLDGYTVNVLEMRSQVDAALAAPPRNCDVGTARQQEKRHKEEVCPKSACPQHEGFVSKACRGCFAMWAQMPCKEGGAK